MGYVTHDKWYFDNDLCDPTIFAMEPGICRTEVVVFSFEPASRAELKLSPIGKLNYGSPEKKLSANFPILFVSYPPS